MQLNSIRDAKFASTDNMRQYLDLKWETRIEYTICNNTYAAPHIYVKSNYSKKIAAAATMMMMKMKKIFHYTRQYNLWSSNDCDIGRMVVCSKSKISKVLVPVFALKELNFEHVVVVVVVCTISLCCCCSCWCYCCWFQIDDVYYVRSLAHICANRVKKTKAQSARARAKDPVWYSQCMWRSHIDLVHLLLCVRACVRAMAV